jgi:hypothetical protein
LFVVSCRAFFIAKKDRSAVGGFLGNGVSVKCQRHKNVSKFFREGGGGKGRAKLEEYCAQNFKEILRNRLRLTCG